ncbi:prevent-host-death protein [Chryseobacterium antibioticum]|uniref:Prevent-host-death protein n=2 Tax=Chryseobacterium TaxID=59732 RepID=A0A7Y0AM90_9FLAO|nr:MULTISPECIES: prevent-host-death protein [Chryseobacterium]MCT2406431.1 prevent-host-death protein [Chryseobacterium pyrolae]NML69963.1 prevent-host-death protein [Chryseobacterium antibioticum]
MNYTLELSTQESDSNIVFNTIVFDPFKVNIVERYVGRMNFHPKLSYVLFKVRTLDNEIIKTKEGNGRVKIKGDHFETYQKLIQVLNSYDYKNRLINRQEADQNYVHFILSLVLANYQLN